MQSANNGRETTTRDTWGKKQQTVFALVLRDQRSPSI